MSQMNIFGTETQLARISKLGDPLLKINQMIDWEMFREPIETAIRKDMSKGGRPPYDAVLMFKITMLQQWNGMSDMAVEYQVNCRRLCFKLTFFYMCHMLRTHRIKSI